MNKYQQKHIITLSSRQKIHLQDITRKGKHNSRVIKRARVLLKSAEGWKDADIASSEEVCIRTVENIRARFAEGKLKRALPDAPRTGQPRKLNDAAEAHLVALACSDPPEGRERWTLKLLQKKMVEDKQVDSISDVCILSYLQNRKLKPWREKNVVHTETYGRVH